MTPQQIFDTIAVGLIEQGMRSSDESGNCLYRGPNGLKCAAGMILPDDCRPQDYEGYGFRETLWQMQGEGLSVPEYVRNNVPLISTLQTVHDNPESWENLTVLADKLTTVAESFHLNAAAVEATCMVVDWYY